MVEIMRRVLEVFYYLFIAYMLCYSVFLFFAMTTSTLELHDRWKRRRYLNLPPEKYYLPVSILIPAFNESVSIEGTVLSLLDLDYNIYEIVVIDDGSTDNMANVLISRFGMHRISCPVRKQVKTNPVVAIYESTDTKVPVTLVIKENGGKADSLNVGINVAKYPYVVCMDADSMLEREALTRITAPILEDNTVVAVGGLVRPCNDLKIENGHLVRPTMPRKLLPSLQVLEYDRSFLSFRLFLDRFNANLIVSGAFGLFQKNVLISIGGFETNTIGEDMEVIVRIHTLFRTQRRPYRIRYEPEAVCWTQVPETLHDLIHQRRRWHLGLFQTLRRYRQMAARLDVGRAMSLSYNYYNVYELYSPFIEVFGIFITILSAMMGLINIPFMILFYAVYAAYGWALSLLSFFSRVNISGIQVTPGDGIKAVFYCLFENTFFRAILLFTRLTAFIGYKQNRLHWSKISRNHVTVTSILAVIILTLSIPVTASAATQKFTGTQRQLMKEYETVYIAGSRDSMPLEGVHKDTYIGVMPQFYQKLSDITGMDFVYLDNRTDRYQLAARQQCDILSLVTEDDATLQAMNFIPGPACFTYKGTTYRIAYTQRMPAEMTEVLDDAFAQMSDTDRLHCAISGSTQCYHINAPGWLRTALFIAIGLCIMLVVLLIMLVYRNKKSLQHALTVDPVTKLNNRTGFSEGFRQLKEQQRFSLYYLAYILIDCEQELIFSGDAALDFRMEAGANAIREYLHPDWIAARTDISGYLLCFPAGPKREAADVLKPILDAIEKHMNRDQVALYYRAYAGICRSDFTHGNLDKAINEIRIAAWKAKEQDKRILISSRQLTQNATVDYRHAKEILASINMEDFLIYVCPIVELPNNQVVGGQAVLRWQHPTHGMLMPDEFLPYIEKTNKMKELDFWVFEQICSWSRQRREKGLSPILVTCTLSNISLNSSALYGTLMEKVARYDIRPGEIGIEVNSGMLGQNAKKSTLETLEDLHAAGITVVLDNFGSDDPALGALVSCTADMVKLHSGLLPKETKSDKTNRRQLHLLDNAINLCNQLGICIICSGIEDEMHHSILQKAGCHLVLGDHYYRPMPCDEFDRNFR